MARPKSPELTQRELELMQVFWDSGAMTAAEARERFANAGSDLAYTTVATLVKILVEKKYLKQQGEHRPFTYEPIRSFEDVSTRLVGDLVKRVFGGSREQLLVRLFDGKKLSNKERELLEQVLREGKQ
ncbi:BlaI/MecI/CopY family transcriptional regulator [Aeoliella mucimassa]|uniref:Penicillinase repressor n=1 Tax=Aeoliella mucimassa TaxID=2527972 RepID=A0A518AHQ1_9BACT|nr:BlaI/MecI/CopY family transcriptional regulator [Aeoliella mucimassa]QDU54225.1 Penicillinase repressor [Aeoliella mucimassa]